MRYAEVVLTIADNEAATALATLRRFGLPVEALRRSDVYGFEIESTQKAGLLARLREVETIFNPNKHALALREGTPAPGEVWIQEILAGVRRPEAGNIRLAGKSLTGVRQMHEFTAWRLTGTQGIACESAIVREATESLLCNPAFQKARFSE